MVKSENDSKKNKYAIDMCNGPLLKKMLLFSIPLMCSSILQLLFNAADIIVVGRFAGSDSLAGVGSNSALISLLTNLFVGLSIGTNVLCARFYGARRNDDLSKTIHTSMLISLAGGILLTVVGVVFSRPILILMQTPKDVLPLAVTYMKIYFAGMTAMMVYNFGSAILRAIGDTRRPLIFLSIAGALNVGLNLYFVICLHMDVAGVALATVISQCLSAILIIRCLMQEEGSLHLDIKLIRLNRAIFLQILRIGLPAGIQGILFSFSNVIVQSAVNGFGSTVVAGNSASANLELFVYFAMNAFYQAAISFVSQNFGAGKLDRILKILITCQICVVSTGMLVGFTFLAFGPQLLGIYSTDAAVISDGMIRLRMICGTYFLCGIMEVMVGALRGLGCSIMPTIVSLLGACVLRIIWIMTIFQIPQYHTLTMLYVSYPVTWIITISVHIICFIYVIKKLRTSSSAQKS